MLPPRKSTEGLGREAVARLFAVLFGALLGLALVKFGNPVILSSLLDWPGGVWEWLFFAWPLEIGYALLAAVTLVGLFCVRWRSLKLNWLAVMPLIWFGWQLVSATQSVAPRLTHPTLAHFATCVVCYYLGCLGLSRVRRLDGFWLGILCGFVLMLASGFQQHFGGLEETRRQLELYSSTTRTNVPAELLKRVSSDRIFATSFYPNSLAGTLLLFLPALMAFLWRCQARLVRETKALLLVAVGIGGLACLYWSGSKGGWLLMLALALVALLHLPFGRQWKLLVVAAVLALGLAGFFWRYAGYFEKGAKSVDARLDYWRAAAQIALARPVSGSGPGTFGAEYERIKRPESEMSREVHNDYLEQASDSGLPGFVAYCVFVLGALGRGYVRFQQDREWLVFAVWLGVLGWALQGLMEFGLYIPALAWPAFAFLGWFVGLPRNRVDNAARAG